MFNPEKVKGFSKLDKEGREVFRRFCEKFYKAWEHPEDHVPTSVKRIDSKYLKVVLSDGDWLHILKDGSWY
ncbi:hypothetical protein [Clostridium sp. AWRP]|uniref:hypothetical protein n=1 Tax=Clostridium sp. AWRP TaxID=2212991 RepID=UPI000FDAE2DF|nr:hypothetical protein [Clostridium sp. AWRP]AZV56773.1 hypothetical protein DMR38_09260 [Clostridium sp. AWRP]